MGSGGHATFTSILWSASASNLTASGTMDYYVALGKLLVDVLLLFGAVDLWCTTAMEKWIYVVRIMINFAGGDGDSFGNGEGRGSDHDDKGGRGATTMMTREVVGLGKKTVAPKENKNYSCLLNLSQAATIFHCFQLVS